jgi:hypothetical protein
MENLGNGSEAVGGATGVGHDGHVGGVVKMVDTNNKSGGGILGRAGNDGLLGATLNVESSLVGADEHTGGFTDVVGAQLVPSDFGGIGLVGNSDVMAIDLDATFSLLDSALELS